MSENKTNCKFCSHIFDEQLLYCRTIRGSERHKKQQAERMKLEELEKDYGGNHIFHFGEGFCIFGNSGDPFQSAGIDNVSYCPYCGRKLGDKK